jgi:hypothetical protein
MNFEELQVIWNTQDQRPLYAIDETAVQTELWRQRQTLRRTWFRWNILPAYVAGGLLGVMIALNLLLVAIDVSSAIARRAVALWVAAGVALIYFVAATLRARQQERLREEASTGSLREELERGIARLEYEIRAGGGISAGRRAIPLFVALFVATSLAMWAVADIMDWSLWLPASVGPLMLLGLPVELWRHHRRVTRDLRPRLQSLQALRAKLTNPGGT